MDTTKRLELMNDSKQKKKMEELMKHREKIKVLMKEEVSKLPDKTDFSNTNKTNDEDDKLESQMMVCVRSRPLLHHEQLQDHLQVVHTLNPKIVLLEPVMKEWKTEKVVLARHEFSVDQVFGADDDNDVVYCNTVHPLLDTATRGKG